MSARIRNFFRNNIGLKIVALLLSGALWLLVYNIEDPTRSATYTIPVTITGQEVLEEMNKCYEVKGTAGQINVTVAAKRTVLEKLSSTDFTATADMTNMTISENGKTGSIPVEISAGRMSATVKLSTRAKYIEVSLEDLGVKQFVVSAAATGEVAEGYALGTVAVESPNVLKVSGPVSLVETVDKVVASIDVEGMSQNISDNVVPLLYDEDGNEINSNRLTLSNTTVSVRAIILNTKQVPIRISLQGSPEEGYYLADSGIEPGEVWVKGSVSSLNRLSEIAIPSEVLDISGASEGMEFTLDITEYLPDGVELLDKTANNVVVFVDIQKSSTKTYALPVGQIEIIGLADDMELQYNTTSVNAVITGTEEALSKLNISQIKCSVDVSELAAGIHYVPVTLEMDEAYAYGNVRVSVTISEKTEEE